MLDPATLLDTLAGFAETLTRGCEAGDVLHELAVGVAEVLGLTGAGVMLVRDGRVHFVTAAVETIADLERVQEDRQAGPCVEATATGRPVTADDLMTGQVAQRWPAYAQQARVVGVRAVAGIPMVAEGRPIGALSLYHSEPRSWSTEDLRIAKVLSDLATSHLVHATALEQQRRTAEQLQQALDTRIVIEQAKGILAGSRGISIDEAFQLLRKHSRDHNARIHDVAAAVVHLGMRP